jgi:mRNA interferase RelE/StbE
MNFKYSKQAMKVAKRLDSVTAQRIKTAIEKLPDGDIKQIKGVNLSIYRLRVGDWRILYFFEDDNTIFIDKIAPRGEVYKEV